MHFSSLTRAVNCTAAACSLQTQAGAPAGQAAQSAVQRSAPSVTHIMGYYSFNWPWRDGRLSWPCWLTDSGRRTYKVVKQPSISLAQDKESPPARTDVLTTMLRHQDRVDVLLCLCCRRAGIGECIVCIGYESAHDAHRAVVCTPVDLRWPAFDMRAPRTPHRC